MTSAVDHRAVRHVADLQAVYRMFDDSGALLYVGVTGNPASRFRSHAEKRWFPLTAAMTFEWFPTREAAERAEQRAIRNERPQLNIRDMANPRPYTFTRDELVAALTGLPAEMPNAEAAADAIIQAIGGLQDVGGPPPGGPDLDEDTIAALQLPAPVSDPAGRKLSVIVNLIPSMTIDNLRKYSLRWDDFPKPVGRDGPANLYRPEEVCEWVRVHRRQIEQRRAS